MTTNKAPVMSMGEAVGRRNNRVRQVLAAHHSGPLVVDVGAGSLDHGSLLPGGRYLRTDIRALPGLDLAADATRLPLKADSVDVVMGLELLEHVPDVAAVMREAHRVLRPGGLAIFSTVATFPRHDTHDYLRFSRQGLETTARRTFPGATVEVFGHTFETLAVLAGYYFQLMVHRRARPLERVIPFVERVGHRLDRRVPWASTPDGLHTLHCDLLLLAVKSPGVLPVTRSTG